MPPRIASAPSLNAFTMTYQIGYSVTKQTISISTELNISKIALEALWRLNEYTKSHRRPIRIRKYC